VLAPRPDRDRAERRSGEDEPSNAYAAYVLAVLFVVYVFNFADRKVL